MNGPNEVMNALISEYRARQDVEMLSRQLAAAQSRLRAAEAAVDAIAQSAIDNRLEAHEES